LIGKGKREEKEGKEGRRKEGKERQTYFLITNDGKDQLLERGSHHGIREGP